MNGLDVIYTAAAVVTAPWWLRKKRGGWGERFGRVEAMLGGAPLGPSSSERPRLLLHGVSVGEVSALRGLVRELEGRAELVIATTTDTGLARARELYEGRARIVRYPLDASWSVARFITAVKPDAIGLVELELWPNFLEGCTRAGIPVAVINGRLSERSFARYFKHRNAFGGIASRMFRSLAFAAVQDATYAERFEAMGVRPGDCLLTGSMKWDGAEPARDTDADARADQLAAELGLDANRPVIVAGSTAEGEEELLHAACPAGVQLVCAPRRPERFDAAAEAMPGCVRRSTGPVPAGSTPDRILLDSIGELGVLYRRADVVVLGRSFFGMHGSDPTEPASLGKPVLIGPHHGDFDEPVHALVAAGGLAVTPPDELAAALDRLITDAEARRVMGEAAGACAAINRGASARHAELLLGLTRAGISAAVAREAARTPRFAGAALQ